MFHVKICGVRKTADVRAVSDAGADAVGLNFFPRSVRYLDPLDDTTQAVSELAGELGLIRVAVVVNRSAESLAELVDRVSLDAVQLHGDESIEDLESIRNAVSLPIVRAIKLPRGPLTAEQIATKTEPWNAAGCHLLLDADAGGQHGGSGKTLDWPSVANWAQRFPGTAWTLAGGLTPENVAQAVRETGAPSVDTASGVEKPKGEKDAEKIREFCLQSGLRHS